MQQTRPELPDEAAGSEAGFVEPAAAPAEMADRGTPGWGRLLSVAFAATGAICLLTFPIFTLFIEALVANERELILAPLLTALATVPALGIVVLEVAHARALAGFRHARDRTARMARGWFAVSTMLVLGLVHPLIALPCVACGALLWATVSVLSRRALREPLWDFRPAEAVSVLSGRDAVGLRAAAAPARTHPAIAAVRSAFAWFALIATVAAASWLVARDVLGPTSIAALGLISFLSVTAIGRWAADRAEPDPFVDGTAATVDAEVHPPAEEDEDPVGLRIRQLAVRSGERVLIPPLDLDVAPGTICGVQGAGGAGKSLLLRALISPHDLAGLDVSGDVTVDGAPLWRRATRLDGIRAVLVQSPPPMLPASGADNLSCFDTGDRLDRGRRVLERLLFSSDLVEKICAAPDATLLSTSEQSALAVARALVLSPRLYLLDRPEFGLSRKAIGVLLDNLKKETRSGRTIVLVSEDRELLSMCDTLVVLQDGLVVDSGSAEEIMERENSGWTRFVGRRALDTDDNLKSWLRSHFIRKGDEGNQRRLAAVGSELLALSCQTGGEPGAEELRFEFKHFKGHCVLRMLDTDPPIGSAQFDRARNELEAAEVTTRLSPLARIMDAATSVETGFRDGWRVVEVQVETYDPRLARGTPPPAAG